MPQQKLTIVPVSLHPKEETSSPKKSVGISPNPTCTIKTGTIEISFFNGIDEHIIQTVMKELKN